MFHFHQTRAFTLIELLVVLSIIALLIAILLPTLQSVCASARAVTCASHQRQIGVMFHVYASEFDAYPAARDPTWGGDASYIYRNALANAGLVGKADDISHKSAVDSGLACPSWTASDRVHTYGYFWGHRNLGPTMGSNGQLASASNMIWARPGTIDRPSDTLALADANNGHFQGHLELGDLGPHGLGSVYHTRHEGSANFLFADGHVAREPSGFLNAANYRALLKIKK